MKIKEHVIFLAVSAAFMLFTLGFFLGRNLIRPSVTTQRIAPTIQTLPQTLPTETAVPNTTSMPEPAFPLNINTASAEELAWLPGIGETIARRIVAYRDANGSFSQCSDLMNVEGIGQTRLEQMLPYITTGG